MVCKCLLQPGLAGLNQVCAGLNGIGRQISCCMSLAVCAVRRTMLTPDLVLFCADSG